MYKILSQVYYLIVIILKVLTNVFIGNSESMNTSSSTPEYVTEDWQAIQSSTTSNSSPSQTDDGVTNIKTIKRR